MQDITDPDPNFDRRGLKPFVMKKHDMYLRYSRTELVIDLIMNIFVNN